MQIPNYILERSGDCEQCTYLYWACWFGKHSLTSNQNIVSLTQFCGSLYHTHIVDQIQGYTDTDMCNFHKKEKFKISKYFNLCLTRHLFNSSQVPQFPMLFNETLFSFLSIFLFSANCCLSCLSAKITYKVEPQITFLYSSFAEKVFCNSTTICANGTIHSSCYHIKQKTCLISWNWLVFTHVSMLTSYKFDWPSYC